VKSPIAAAEREGVRRRCWKREDRPWVNDEPT